jgi:GTP-binding protein
VVNKWDVVQKTAAAQNEKEKLTPAENRTLMQDFARQARGQLVFMEYAPIVFISAKERWGLDDLMRTTVAAAEQHAMRVATPELSRLVREAAQEHPLVVKGKPLRIYYATQPSVRPPTFVLFVNDPELMHFSYLRYLENRIRRQFGLEGAPLRLVVRESTGEEKPRRGRRGK